VPGGRHVLLCGDSAAEADVARVMGQDRANAMWTDPPYGVAYVGKTKAALTIANDNLKGDALREFLVRCFASAAKCALTEGSAVYVAHPAGALSLEFLLAFREVGWRLHQTLVWKKDSFVLGHADYHYAHEPILFGYVPGAGRRGRGGEGWYGDNAQSSVFEVPKPRSNDEHPTMKPVELVATMLRNSVPVGGIVYEPFSGSGTTLVAAEGAGRVGRGIEIDPKYVAVALERLSAMGLEPALDAAA
jgi:DNA modification methylase